MTELELTPPHPRLPDAALPTAAGDVEVPLREHRRATVLVLLPGVVDEAALAYLRELLAAEDMLTGWDGRVLLVTSDADVAPLLDEARLPFPLLVDERHVVATAAHVAPPAVLVADQWGEVHAAATVDAGESWLAVTEVERWVQWLAIRCAG